MLHHQLESKLWILTTFWEDFLVDLLLNSDVSRAVQFLSSIAYGFIYIIEKACNPKANDYKELPRIKMGKLIKGLKHVKPGNIRQFLHRLKISVPLTKLLQLSQKMKEYLFCLVFLNTASGYQFVLHSWIRRRDSPTDDYANYRTLVANTIPKQPYGSYIPQTQHLVLVKKTNTAGIGHDDKLIILKALRDEILTNTNLSRIAGVNWVI